jgi:hypothetical protein
MAHSFYGPWRIVYEQLDPYPIQRSFVVSGSDGADGRYLCENAQPADVVVQGAEWDLTIETAADLENQTWEAIGAQTQMMVLPGTGLTLVLDTRFFSNPSGEPWGIRLVCTSLDETINPPQRPNPFDFTYTPQD